jgi:steroid delta-isomerase-like uncharacterized protein
MTRDEIQAFVDRWRQAWVTEDLEALLACYDEHVELISPLFKTMRGIEAVERSHQDLFMAFRDIATDIHDIVIDVDRQRAVLVFTIHATQQGEFRGTPASGRRTATPSAFVFHLTNGHIVSERRLYDFGGLLMQLGMIKTKGM